MRRYQILSIVSLWIQLTFLHQSNGFLTPNPRRQRTRFQYNPPHIKIQSRNCNFIRHICPYTLSPSSTSTSTSLSSSAVTAGSEFTRGIGSYFLVRILFLRGLGFVFLTAFLIALHQNKALIGYEGITPAQYTLNDVEQRGQTRMKQRDDWLTRFENRTFDSFQNPYSGNNLLTILKHTKMFQKVSRSAIMRPLIRSWFLQDRMSRPLITLLWLIPSHYRNTKVLNYFLDGIASFGIALSSILLVKGSANMFILFGLWLCQRSLMSVGGPWYGFGWEPQLAELTFHALFLVPFWSMECIAPQTPIPKLVVWTMRWFLFRIMMGAGLIKLRSKDYKWRFRNLSAMHFFYESQPVPNPFSRFLHHLPKLWHKFEVLMNHFVELVAPWGLLVGGLLGRNWLISAGMIQIVFQSILICSGNLSFLNWLTMLPAVFCLDDAFVSRLFHPTHTTSASVASYTHLITSKVARISPTQFLRQWTNLIFFFLICKLSLPVIQNLCSSKQLMNASFDPLRLVNTYGAFGVVDEERIELVIESSPTIDGPWKEYEFKVKPGDIYRTPRWISPYHYRLDWCMWIASSCGNIERSPWMYTFLYKLLQGDQHVLELLEHDPWASSKLEKVRTEEQKPQFIRVEKYLYKYNREKGKGKPYWIREKVGKFFPMQGIASLKTLREMAQVD